MKHSKGYVMRSEKRPAYGSTSGGRVHKPKKPKAGLFYIIMTIIISVILWPVGMIMLWRKKVRMQAGTKLLISLLTMCFCVFLIVFGLTVHVDNEQYTEFQDRANDWLNEASEKLAIAGDAAYQKGLETWGVMKEFTNNVTEPSANTMADAIDRGVALACQVRAKVQGVPVNEVLPEALSDLVVLPTPTANAAAEVDQGVQVHLPENTPAPEDARPLSAGLLTSEGEVKPGETPAPTPTPSPTPVPTETPEPTEPPLEWSAVDENGQPEVASEGEQPLAAAEVEPVADTEAPSGTPEPTPEPTPAPTMTLRVKPAAEARVYYNATGNYYHMQSSCLRMSGAAMHTLAEAVADGKSRCEECGTPDASILDVPYVAWVDKNNVYHTGDSCAKFEGLWTLISLNDAINGDYTACPACEAELYTALYADAAAEAAAMATPAPTAGEEAAAEPSPTAEEENTAEPSPAVEGENTAEPSPTAEEGTEATEVPASTEATMNTPAPEAGSPTPVPTLKPVGEAIVYHSYNGRFYHRHETCVNMTGSNPYKLSEIGDGYRRCRTCDAPDIEMLGKECLWIDENSLCHTSDECANFAGEFNFILIDDAIEQGLTACPLCGADTFLVPAAPETDAE